jgi:hypothetical protein
LAADTVLLAGDTTILIQANDEKVLELKMSRTMDDLHNWFYTNGLVINNKTISISFHPWQDKS